MSFTLPSGRPRLLLKEKSVTPENGVAPACVSRSPGVSDLRTSAVNDETPNAAEAGGAANPIAAARMSAAEIPRLIRGAQDSYAVSAAAGGSSSSRAASVTSVGLRPLVIVSFLTTHLRTSR